MVKGTGRLVNPYLNHMKCKKCGQEWIVKIEPCTDGKFYRGSWQCPNGCKAY